MKKNSVFKRAICFAGSAVLLAGLMAGLGAKEGPVLSVSAAAQTVTAGSFYQVNASSLNVRSGPGLGYVRRGSLADGTVVKILETSGSWGRTSQGWICLDYLVDAGNVQQQEPAFTAYVTASSLNVRLGPGPNYAVCGQVMNGYKLLIESTQDGWGRISNGWVNLKYVSRTGTAAPNQEPAPDPKPSQKPAPGYSDIDVNTSVQSTVNLNVRKGPGIGYPIVGALMKGKTDTVLEVQGSWGRTNTGWISLNYVRPCGDESHVSYRDQLVEVTADSLNIRTGPGFHYQSSGAMTKGYRTYVSYTENGWGRTNTGWISMDYVKLVR